MPKVTTKRKNAPQEPTFDDPSFPDISYDPGEGLDVGNEGNKQGKGNGQDAQMAELMKQIGAMNERFEQQQQVMQQLMASPVPYSPNHQEPTLAPKTDELPDPALDPQAFGTTLQERILAGVKQLMEANQTKNIQQQAQQSRADTLWDEFSDQYPDYADNPERMEFVAQTIARRAKDRGIDIDRYMFVTRDRFMKDLTKEYDNVFGNPVEDDDGSKEPDEGDAGRTGGIFGGLESGGRMASGSADEGKTDMIKQLQEMQRKRGIY